MTMIRTKTAVLVAALFLAAAFGFAAAQDKPADKPAAPDWYTEGVSHLKLKDDLKERAKDLKPADKVEKKEPEKKEPEKK